MVSINTTIVVSRFWPARGGSEMHSRSLALGLARSGHSLRVVCHSSDDKTTPELALTQQTSKSINDSGLYDIHRVCASGRLRCILQRIAKYHASCKIVRPMFDVLVRRLSRQSIVRSSSNAQVIHSIYNGLTSTAESSLAAARELGIPFIWTPLACTTLPNGTGWSSMRFRKLYRQADAVIALTDHERHWLICQGADPERTFVCPMGPMVEAPASQTEFRRRYGLTHSPVVLFLGRHDQHKGYQRVQQVMPLVWKHHPETQFLFIGPQTSESAKSFHNLSDSRVTMIEHISQADKNAALALCDFLCVPSSLESLGVVYLEAWHYRKAVIALEIPLLRTVITHNVDGLLVKSGSTNLGDAICHLLDYPEEAISLGINGQQTVSERYSWPSIIERHEIIYRFAIENPRLNSQETML
ncbi:glycosyltransferase family 4 protein [Marinobacter sp. CA1]|uniref:glycosyltransferase family 4 protein n=1 Tax=Marinobacter sp. CA1 TaxID=2817656 RepID=UPI001D079387|nr:glycosyltransferase family 4 protein [Marinobacter sp. CA1]UDL07031.1 glycosyltransferase family 4 protein [Marinobacter sp. CA1]